MALCLADAIIECDGQINADVIGKHICAGPSRSMPLTKTC
jgi:hypothetical protein